MANQSSPQARRGAISSNPRSRSSKQAKVLSSVAKADRVIDYVRDKSSLAEKLFKARAQYQLYENDIHDLLDAHGIICTHTQAKYDWYHRSIELFGVPSQFVLSKQQQDLLWDIGFSRAWTHEANSSHLQGECAYWKPQ